MLQTELTLLHVHHWTPQQIDRLTLPEIEMALHDPDKPFGGVQLDPTVDLEEYAAWRRGLTWADKIAIARDEA